MRFIQAAAFNDSKKLLNFLHAGFDVDSCDQAGRSALHLASSEGNLDSVKVLLKCKANVNIRDKTGNRPIHEAWLGGHKAVIEALVKGGANSSQEFINELEMRMRQFAARGDLEHLRNLVETGICADAVDYCGRTALHIASERGHVEMVDYLRSKSVEVNTPDNDAETAISLAEKNQHVKIKLALVGALEPSVTVPDKRWLKNLTQSASFTVMEAFPRPIAAALLSGRKVEPFSKPTVSILVSDICGFTTMSSIMTAETVAKMLSSLFRKFDRLAHLHGVQKVDMVGDSYIAATNFTEDQPGDHASRLAHFAIDMLAAARKTQVSDSHKGLDPPHGLPLRIGLHCGPVSAMLVGDQATKYTLMGEASVTASRMESGGLPGQIHCSGAFARAVLTQANDIVAIQRSVTVEASRTATVSRDPLGPLHSFNPAPPHLEIWAFCL
jgi:class 3 adenylate cyclase